MPGKFSDADILFRFLWVFFWPSVAVSCKSGDRWCTTCKHSMGNKHVFYGVIDVIFEKTFFFFKYLTGLQFDSHWVVSITAQIYNSVLSPPSETHSSNSAFILGAWSPVQRACPLSLREWLRSLTFFTLSAPHPPTSASEPTNHWSISNHTTSHVAVRPSKQFTKPAITLKNNSVNYSLRMISTI